MTLFRCFGWNSRAGRTDPDGPCWVPRVFQGDGRHDNPDLYGCLYLSTQARSAMVEQLAPFRGTPLRPSMLRRRGLPLALAELELAGPVEIVDFDDPVTLRRLRLRPSHVATRQRAITQPQARALYERQAHTAGLRWWSTYEALWMNVTVFDRAARNLRVRDVRLLTVADPEVVAAAEFLGLQTG